MMRFNGETTNGTVLERHPFFDAVQDFFFAPSSPHTLAVIRVMTGLMIAYIHMVWMMNLDSFMGPNAFIDNATWRAIHLTQSPDYKWTYLAFTESMTLIWVHEIFALIAGIALAIGFQTRIVGCLAWLLTLMTVHRMTGLLFGLDQVTVMLAMYLCLGSSGDVWSVDAMLRNQKLVEIVAPSLCWSNTLATRLIQLHLCVIYLFGGIGKMRGGMWWDGSAFWYSVAAYEYQSLDMTWMGYLTIVSSIATHITLFWEVMYCAVIWPTRTRPWMIGIAILVHGGIALFLGMVTFGSMMIVANLAFVSPDFIQNLLRRIEKG